MAKYKTADLEGEPLNAAVAMAEGKCFATAQPQTVRYSLDWQCGGQIIERERIDIEFLGYITSPVQEPEWRAVVCVEDGSRGDAEGLGPTPLIAAMRAYVASKLGHEVDLS